MDLRKTLNLLLRWIYFPRDYLFCVLHGWRWDPGWRFHGLPVVRCGGNGSRIEIGRSFVACSSSRNNVIGVFQPVILATCRNGASIAIGDRVGVSGCTISAAKSIRIGNDVLIGSGVLVTDCDWHPLDPLSRRTGSDGASSPVVIEDDVFIGARAIVLKGVRIGRDSVVGAGSVVVGDVPPGVIIAGNPAKVIGIVSQRQ